MALLSTLVDDFNDNSISANWPLSYGGVSETGGRARVPCSQLSYAGYQTDTVWTFDSFFVNLPTIGTLNSATVECYTSAWIFSAGQDPGTHVGFLGDRTTGNLYFMSRVGYVDAGALSVTLNPTTHAWWRLRISGANLVWETSPDGITWTTQRTLATPAWVSAATDCKLLLESHRNDGTDNFSEFDNLNVPQFSTVTATGSATLGGITAAGTGIRTTPATAAPTLGGLTGAATGVRTVVASAAPTLGALTAAATGVRTVAASSAVQLGGVTAAGTAVRTVLATSSATLGALSASAVGSTSTVVSATGSAVLGGLVGQAVAAGGTVHRPDLGTIARPSTGTVTRPYAGIVARP